jgi:hypothetical protein
MKKCEDNGGAENHHSLPKILDMPLLRHMHHSRFTRLIDDIIYFFNRVVMWRPPTRQRRGDGARSSLRCPFHCH